jgi:glycerol-3-phosphate dehydrogenase (NAD(P)+)
MGAANNIAILGAGSWGTALAQLYAESGWRVQLWSHRAAVAAEMQQSRRHPRFFPQLVLAPTLTVTDDLAAALAEASDVILAIPSSHVVELAARIAPLLNPQTLVINAAKGFVTGSSAASHQPPQHLLLDAIRHCLPDAQPLAVLSGPNFAGEVAGGLPCAATLGCTDSAIGMRGVERLSLPPRYRLYHNSDVIGVQVGGALKNVVALAAGMAMGAGLGENARAALITRGLAEMARLAEVMGGLRTTLMGLAGLGDLLLTATSEQSRNYRLGLALGRGEKLEQLLAEHPSTVEGVSAAASIASLCQDYAVELPLISAVQPLLQGKISLPDVVQALLTRPFRAEA